MRMKFTVECRSLIALILCTSLLPAAELPVKTVVLYKHGVGYFERSGPLSPGESARVDFNENAMNDVLKSLTINDQGGKVTGLRYDSSIPLEQKLDEFPFRISNGEPLAAVLDQLKGSRIELDFGSQKVAGAIVSARLITGDKDHAEREQLTLLMDSGDLRNVDLAAAASIRFTDTKLQLQFRDYLSALTGARSKDKRSVYIDSTDAKSHDVEVSYIMPMPAWKSSYRLMLDSAESQPVLEGWAIVDNTTGEDWINVRMSLVSGKPISFISQLYAPKYIERRGAELAEDQALSPTVYSGAVAGLVKAAPGPSGGGGAGVVGGAPGAMHGVVGGIVSGLPAAPPPPAPKQFSMEGLYNSRVAPSTVETVSSGQEIADLFKYAITNPVTVKKNESAMLPFLQQKIAARKLIVYSDTSRPNPLNAVELTNSTGLTLDGGPVTVYDAGAYAGEALTETIKAQDKRLISYGVDLGVRISTNQDSRTDNVRSLTAHNGILTTRNAIVTKKIYAVRNVDPRAKTLIIEYPVRSGFTLVDTTKPIETARDVYRFEVKVPASGDIDFPITEENVYDQQMQISSMNPDILLTYVRNQKLSDSARRQLQQIADIKIQIVAADSERKRVDADIESTTRDEQRNRENIASLSQVSNQQQLVQDYARKLADQEVSIAKSRDRQKELDQQKTQLQSQLNNLIEKLEF
jgi:hypothetical protein